MFVSLILWQDFGELWIFRSHFTRGDPYGEFQRDRLWQCTRGWWLYTKPENDGFVACGSFKPCAQLLQPRTIPFLCFERSKLCKWCQDKNLLKRSFCSQGPNVGKLMEMVYPIGSCMLYMVTFTINISPMLEYIPYMDPMGMSLYTWATWIFPTWPEEGIAQWWEAARFLRQISKGSNDSNVLFVVAHLYSVQRLIRIEINIHTDSYCHNFLLQRLNHTFAQTQCFLELHQ